MLKNVLFIFLLATGASLAVGGMLAPTDGFAAESISKKVGDPLEAAIAAANSGKYSEALASVKQADGVSGKSATEQLKINETYGFIYLKQRNYAQAAVAYERSLNSGQLPAGKVNDRLKQLAQLNFQPPRNLEKVIDYSTRYLQAVDGRDASIQAMMGQAYQMSGNDKAAVTSIRNAIRVAGKAEENWLRILMKSYGNLNDKRGLDETTQTLVRMYPTKDNWRLLSGELRRQASGDDRTALNVYRLMSALDLMDKPDIYMEAAIVAIQSGLPAEAVTIMERGYDNKVFGPKDEARGQRILADAKKRAAAQQPMLGQLTQTATSSTAGRDEVLLGEVLLSYGQIDKAVAAGKRAIQKGADPDEVWMLVGRCQVQLKNGAEARKAFAQVKGEDAAPVAKLWGIYASRI
jgi:tetratricopeptide (TPR) repeat protein